jgi:hypothetical protein
MAVSNEGWGTADIARADFIPLAARRRGRPRADEVRVVAAAMMIPKTRCPNVVQGKSIREAIRRSCEG